jgi:hydrogenase-1 operon protein HyaE
MHPLIQALAERHGFAGVSEKTLDDVAAPLPIAMLTICGDPKTVSESLDLAIVAPEIVKAFRGAVTPLLAMPEAERHFQMRFGFSLFPALVLLRHGEYLGAITRIRDWSEYMAEIPALLQRAPSAPPQFELPRGCGNLAAH